MLRRFNMTQTTLTIDNLKHFGDYGDDEQGLLNEIACRMEKGEKLLAKLVTTANEMRVDVYQYDKSLYRYVKFKSIIIGD